MKNVDAIAGDVIVETKQGKHYCRGSSYTIQDF